MSQKINDVLNVVIDQLFDHDSELRRNPDFHDYHRYGEFFTGFDELNEHIVQIEPNSLTIISGHSGAGKSMFLINLLMGWSFKAYKQTGILYFDFETTAEQLMLRFLACYMHMDLQHLRTAQFDQIERDKLSHAKKAFDDTQLHICDNPSMTFEQLVDAIHDFVQIYPNAIIMIDDLQRIRPNIHTAYKYSRAETYSEMTRFLKQLARELNIRIVAISQLTHDAALTRLSKRPILSDLSAFGSLKDNADLVLFIYRDEMHYSKSKHTGIAEIIVAKHRYGPRGLFFLQFVPQVYRFKNLSSKYQNPDEHEDYILH